MNNNLSFKEWLSANEATTTSSIATFSRPVGMIRRKFADTIATNKDKFKGAIDCAKDPKACIKPTVDKTVDCVKDPKSCVKKGVGVVKGMHKDLEEELKERQRWLELAQQQQLFRVAE